jgi:hypothetical protein
MADVKIAEEARRFFRPMENRSPRRRRSILLISLESRETVLAMLHALHFSRLFVPFK